MRYGVIADVHANLNALDTVLAALRRAGVDRFLCTGDLVGYGPRPNECVARIAEIEAITVAGNHDLMATGALGLGDVNPHVKRTIEWTRAWLDESAAAFLGTLPRTVTTRDGVTLGHGSLDDPTEYVYDCRAGRDQLELLREREPAARGLLLGHTHLPLACAGGTSLLPEDAVTLPDPDTAFLLNPGSVGQARERRPVARAVVLDLDARRAEFMVLQYDHEATSLELRNAGLPSDACHRPPRLRHRLRRYLGRQFGRP